MAVSQSNQYKNEKRNYYKSITREGMFVSDYVQIKYKSIYQEAASLYNQINQKYPRKPDLRKTTEYRHWKNSIAAANNTPTTPIPRQKKYRYNRMIHRNIPLNTTTSPPHITTSPSEMSISDETPPPTESPVPQNPPPEENQSAGHQIDKRIAGMTMRLSIPLIQMPTSRKAIQHPDGILAPASQEIVMEEGNQPEVLDPSIFDEISPETMEKLIDELQRDPDLKDIMDDVQNSIEEELNIEEELIGLTIDLPELEDPLEEEALFW